MIDAMKLVKAIMCGDDVEYRAARDEANDSMTEEEYDVVNSFLSTDLPEELRKRLGIMDRPIPQTVFEATCHDKPLLDAYRICLAKCWMDAGSVKGGEEEANWAGIVAFRMLELAGIIKCDGPEIIDLTKEGEDD